MKWKLKRIVIGEALQSNQLKEQKITKKKALAVFSSDALSSVAYATEEILLSLTLAGSALLGVTLPIAIAICVLLVTITVSYRQIISNFPSGGGSYVVAKNHLSLPFSLAAGASLMIDYILTVAVSITSGVAALLAAFPSLGDYRIEIGIGFVLFVMLLNLRGLKESATIFSIPTYLFIVSAVLVVILGFYRLIMVGWIGYGDYGEISGASVTNNAWILFFIILRAFSSGCSAMTGVEAISNGIPSFQEPEQKNANQTMLWMSTLLGFMFIGITALVQGFGILPKENTTVLAQLTHHIVGGGMAFLWMQMITAGILFMAANTAYADFPNLSQKIASDGFLPRNLTQRGDRLVFSNGIVFLSLMSIILIVIFKGSVHKLIPLYAVGVFLSFTIGQWGMINKLKEDPTKKVTKAILKFGMCVTGLVTVITAVAKFTHGAWLILIVIPVTMLIFYKIKLHYIDVAKALTTENLGSNVITKMPVKVIIPVASITTLAIRSISYAKSITDDITIISVIFDESQKQKILDKLEKLGESEINIIFIESPYRSLIGPLYQYIDNIEKEQKGTMINVVIPQFIDQRFYYNMLHNQSAFWIRFVLMLRKDIVLTTIPYHLKGR